MTNARDHLEAALASRLNKELDDYIPHERTNRRVLQLLQDSILNRDAGAGDGCSVGDVLAEMPIDSNCGNDCEKALNAAIELTFYLIMAYRTDRLELIEGVLTAAIEACCCFIRG